MTNAADTRLAMAMPSEIGAGVLSGGLCALYAVSFSYIVFGGALEAFAGQGIQLILLGSFVVCLGALLRRPFAGTMWQAQSVVAVLVGLASANLAAGPMGQTPDVVFATVLALLAITGVMTGGLMMVIGLARLGQIAKSVPYPVVGGFLAATGCLLLIRAVEFAAMGPVELRLLLSPGALGHWLPPVSLALLMLLGERRLNIALTLVLGSLCTIAVVYGGIGLSGMSLGEAREAGILLKVEQAGGGQVWPVTSEVIGNIDWSALLAQYALIATAALLAALGALLNLSAIEFSTGETVDLDAEMRAAGLANLFVGGVGGLVGYQSATLTQLVYGIATRPSRLVPASAAVVVLCVLLAGPDLLGFFPRSLFCMLLAYLGLGFLRRWLIDERHRMPRDDYLIVLLILGVTLAAGFVWAVIAGVVVASMRFTVAYARLPVLRSAVTGAVRLSSTERSERATCFLVENGQQTLIFEAQGYMFFGTANALFSQVDRALHHRQMAGHPARHLVIDLTRVQGVDVSAVYMFDRLARQTERRGVELVFSGLREGEQSSISRGIEHGDVRFFPSLDDALISLEEEALGLETGGESNEDLIALDSGIRNLLDRIEAAGAPVDFRSKAIAAGARIFVMGEEADSLVVLEAGRLYATVQEEATPARRVATFLPGAVVGEIGLVTGAVRTASVIAETDAMVRVVTRDELAALKAFDPWLALELSERISTLMAQRLARTTALLHAVSS